MDYLNKIKIIVQKEKSVNPKQTKKLLAYGINKEETQKIVEILVKQKYIDEKRYASVCILTIIIN